MTICILIALSFGVVATVEWTRLPLAGRLHLGVATAFALGALDHATPFASQPRDGVAYVVALAGLTGVAALVASACGVALGAVAASRR